MGFEFKVRGISKIDKKRLCTQYEKKFRKDKDVINVACSFLLEIIYLYFENDKEKLFKLFFPVVTSCLIEKGSIHSITQEYKDEKELYSWSYTYRIINTLDENVGLEIGRVFRDITLKILKKNGFKNKGYCVAIDTTIRPFYGDKDLFMIKGCKRKDGTNYGLHYLTASIIEEGVRFNLMCIHLPSLTSVARRVENLINEIRKMVPTKLFFLDRGFCGKEYCKIIRWLKHKFIMPITKNKKLKELEYCMKEEAKEFQNDEYAIVALDYVFSEDRAKEYQEKVRLLILYTKGEVVFFITNIFNLTLEEYHDLTKVYRYRFGIETNYRVDNIFNPFTSSVTASTRYLLMQTSLIVQDVWMLANFIKHDDEKKQPREKYKNEYSLIDIIRARIQKLDLVWRPIIPAISFKRKANLNFQ